MKVYFIITGRKVNYVQFIKNNLYFSSVKFSPRIKSKCSSLIFCLIFSHKINSSLITEPPSYLPIRCRQNFKKLSYIKFPLCPVSKNIPNGNEYNQLKRPCIVYSSFTLDWTPLEPGMDQLLSWLLSTVIIVAKSSIFHVWQTSCYRLKRFLTGIIGVKFL